MAHRGAEAAAERLGTTPVIFPSDHGGFLGGEYGQAGDPDGFAAKLREVLAGGLNARGAACHDARMDVAAVAGLVFAIVAGGVIVFQLALALGAPWGEYAMGGAFPGRFPPRMRVAAVVQAILIAVLALVVLSAAGLVLPELAIAYPWLVWVAVAVSALAVVLNAISRSAGERRIWVPVATVLLLSSLVVALDV